MSSKKSQFRVLGQRSLPSSFSSCYKQPVKVVDEDPDKGSHVSILDFSEPKLHQNSGVPTTIKVRSRPFSTLLGPRDLNESIDEKIGAKKGGKAEKNPVAVALALAQFKHTDLRKGPSMGSSSAAEAESSKDYVVHESRKRRNPFQGGDDKHIARKHFAVLGGNPKPKQKKKRDEISKEKPRTVYNHYANGCGWWDCNMEGVDNEEVGLNEVWEGVGSTTLGGLEWH